MDVVLTEVVELPIEGTLEAVVEEASRTVSKTPNGKDRT